MVQHQGLPYVSGRPSVKECKNYSGCIGLGVSQLLWQKPAMLQRAHSQDPQEKITRGGHPDCQNHCAIFIVYIYIFFLLSGIYNSLRVWAFSCLRLRNHTQGSATVGRASLNEWSARRRDLYLITHNTNKRHTSMPPAGFEPAIPAGDRLQTHALDRSANVYILYISAYIWDPK